MTQGPRLFDLNIEEVLDHWEVEHAIREVIANALDEQVLSGTADVDIRTGWLCRASFGLLERKSLRLGPTECD